MNPTKITQIGKKKVNAIERAMNEISGIELADNVLRSCCFATASAGIHILMPSNKMYIHQTLLPNKFLWQR